MTTTKRGSLKQQLELEGDMDTSKAIQLTAEHVAKLRHNKIIKWPNIQDVWALKFGPTILAASNLVTNFFMNRHFRMAFNLHKFPSGGFNAASILLVCALPSLSSLAIIYYRYNSDLKKSAQQKQNECAMCAELRTTSLYLAFGSMFPTILAWMTAYLHAGQLASYRVPSIDNLIKDRKNFRKYLHYSKRALVDTTRNCSGILLRVYGFQVLACSFVLFMMNKQLVDSIESDPFTLAEIKEVTQIEN